MKSFSASFWKDKKVLVTGHAGFKGSWLTLWLTSLGARVSGFSLSPNTTPNLFERLDLASVCDHTFGDIRDLNAVKSVFEKSKPEILFHLAAQPLVLNSYEDPIETFDTNVMGTAKVLEAARKTPSLKAVVIITTDKVYENKESEKPYRETDTLGGKDPYAASKAAAELITKSYRESFFSEATSPRVITVRAGNVIGGGDFNEHRLVVDIARSYFEKEKKEFVLRNPEAVRPWQHVLEPLSGYLNVAQAVCEESHSLPDSLNFGPLLENAVTTRTLAQAFSNELTGLSFKLESSSETAKETKILKLDWSLAESTLGWKPKLTLDETVSLTARQYRRFFEKTSSKELRAFYFEDVQTFVGMS